jgi:acetolactate synthase-1/2/3 large subunit
MRWAGMMRLIDHPAPPPHLIRIDIDPVEMSRLRPHAGIVADAAAALPLLLEAVQKRTGRPVGGRRRILDTKAQAAKRVEVVQPQMAYVDVIRRALPADGILVDELCQVGYATYLGYPVLAPRTYITPGFQGTLGYGYPTALGVKVARPERAVLSIAGDGGFMFGVQELATAAQYGIGVVALVFDNQAYGNVRRDQRTRYQGRVIGSDLVNPDWVRLAESFAIAGHRVASPAALEPVLTACLAAGKAALIAVDIEPDSEVSPWQLLLNPD